MEELIQRVACALNLPDIKLNDIIDSLIKSGERMEDIYLAVKAGEILNKEYDNVGRSFK